MLHILRLHCYCLTVLLVFLPISVHLSRLFVKKRTVQHITVSKHVVLESFFSSQMQYANPFLPQLSISSSALRAACFFCAFAVAASSAVHAQTQSQAQSPALANIAFVEIEALQAEAATTSPATVEQPAWQDLRSSVIAHRNIYCSKRTTIHRLSKHELENLRRVVREHAKNNPLKTAVNN